MVTFKACLDVLDHTHPDWFTLENVDLEEAAPSEESNLTMILTFLREKGYTTQFFRMHTVDHGLPQRRVRLFFIGYDSAKFPEINFQRVERRLTQFRLKCQPPVISSESTSNHL